MTQLDLNRQVARATGESLKTISGRGFSLIGPSGPDFEPDPDDFLPQSIDWDAVDARRRVSLAGRRRQRIVHAA